MGGAVFPAGAIGGAALLAAWVGVPTVLGDSFTAHMAMHLTVVAVAAPALAVAVAAAGPFPDRRWAWLLAPVPASLLEFVVVWGWHMPAFHAASYFLPSVRAMEQFSFLAAGLLLWVSVLAGGRETRGAGVLGLLLTSMHMTLLGALLVFAPRALYAACRPGDAALPDQQFGGMLMLLVGGTVYLAGGLYLLAGLLLDERIAADRPAPASNGRRIR